MVLPITKYGNPVLRQKGARIEQITPEIKQLIADMFETMYAARGIGLAAQQVGHALQLAVIDVREATDRPSRLQLRGEPADVAGFMPLVLINPQLQPGGDKLPGPEGCLSFPEMYSDIVRPESVDVSALNAKGEPIGFGCGGLLARVVQHETDHLRGILFIDRMSAADKADLKEELEQLQTATKAGLAKKKK